MPITTQNTVGPQNTTSFNFFYLIFEHGVSGTLELEAVGICLRHAQSSLVVVHRVGELVAVVVVRFRIAARTDVVLRAGGHVGDVALEAMWAGEVACHGLRLLDAGRVVFRHGRLALTFLRIQSHS